MTKFIYNTRVYYEDTDSAGVVYHANYLKFMERARSEWLLSIGFDRERARELDCQFVVQCMSLKLLKPAHLYDELHVDSDIIRQGRAYLEFEHIIKSKNQPDHIFCTGLIKAVCINQQFKPRAIPPFLLQEVQCER